MHNNKERLIAMGGNAPLNNELTNAFPMGNNGAFAARELPEICRALGVQTLGALAAKSVTEIRGPQCRYAGNKTLDWIAAVCREFEIKPPQ